MSIVDLPNALARVIAEESNRLPLQDLVYAAQRLSAAYRRGGISLPRRLTEAERIAYVAVRLPATYATVRMALAEMSRVVETGNFAHCLDVGAGPGTASLAVLAAMPHVSSFWQVERDPGWNEIAESLARAAGLNASRSIGDVATLTAPPCQLVVAAYVLNELPGPKLDAIVQGLWAVASAALVVVEPGTPRGFAAVRRVREICLELGGHAAAPCTHDAPCPMTSNDWCHQAVRIGRGPLHRKLKLAQLGFEDEKFSYLVMTRLNPRHLARARIVRRPIRAGGHVHLDLCSAEGLSRSTVGRADRASYKAARGVAWGELWPPTTPDDDELG